MIRLTLALIAALFGAMLIWGTETPEMRAEAIARTVLDTAPVPGPKPAGASAPATAGAPPPAVVVARLEGFDLTSVPPAPVPAGPATVDAKTEGAEPAPAKPARSTTRLLIVTGSRVNLRAGPSTARDVVGRLRRGDRAELIAEGADGWMRIREVATGRVGFMSGAFLQTAD